MKKVDPNYTYGMITTVEKSRQRLEKKTTLKKLS